MKSKLATILIVAAAFAAIAALPTVSAQPTSHCEEKQATYTWSYDCSGIDSNGCVGQWGAKGTYTYDANGQHTQTTSAYRSVTCVDGCLEMLGFSIPAGTEQQGSAGASDLTGDTGRCADVQVG